MTGLLGWRLVTPSPLFLSSRSSADGGAAAAAHLLPPGWERPWLRLPRLPLPPRSGAQRPDASWASVLGRLQVGLFPLERDHQDQL